jgi:hypothetical protein
VVEESSIAHLAAVAHAVQQAIEAVASGDRVLVRIRRENRHTAISVANSAPG